VDCSKVVSQCIVSRLSQCIFSRLCSSALFQGCVPVHCFKLVSQCIVSRLCLKCIVSRFSSSALFKGCVPGSIIFSLLVTAAETELMDMFS
jgi:hypothetical protein